MFLSSKNNFVLDVGPNRQGHVQATTFVHARSQECTFKQRVRLEFLGGLSRWSYHRSPDYYVYGAAIPA